MGVHTGEFGEEIYVQYGLFPRAILAIVAALRTRMNTGDGRYVLTASAVELSMVMGNMDMFAKSGGTQKSLSGKLFEATANGVCLDKTTKPPLMYGMQEIEIDPRTPGRESLHCLLRSHRGTLRQQA